MLNAACEQAMKLFAMDLLDAKSSNAKSGSESLWKKRMRGIYVYMHANHKDSASRSSWAGD